MTEDKSVPTDQVVEPVRFSQPSRRSGLGRGLEALIPQAQASSIAGTGMAALPLDAIEPNPWQPRSVVDRDALEELADSIRTHGLLQPIVVAQDQASGKYQIIAGERRWRAARLAGLREAPVVIKDVSSQEMLELALVENVVRADLSPIEEANAYRQLIEEFGLTQAEVAVRVSRSRVTVTNTLRLLGAAEPVQAAIQTGQISEGHARALLGLPSGADQVAMLDLVISKDLSVRETEKAVRQFGEHHARRATGPKAEAPGSAEIVSRLERALSAPVSLKARGNGTEGVVQIAYHSGEELNRLVELLTGDPLF